MSPENPQNAKKRGAYKAQEFDFYAMWKAMPSVLRGQPRQVLEKFGIEDEIAFRLLAIKTQTEFAKEFGVKDLATLSDWNKRLEQEGLIPGINAWARKLTPNVLLALYKTVTKYGKAADVKAWFEIVEGM